jgi:flavin reductase (DIM6/NTAB) family NADH-FMN oxidoreductase RutF
MSDKLKMEVSELDHSDVHKLLLGLIVPRPIGWIGTVSTDGTYNLAPYSFFNAVSSRPPTVIVSPGLANGEYKDTLRNMLDTGEFTVNVVTADLASQMNETSTAQKGDEFSRTGLTAVPGDAVAAPMVGECRANLECRVSQHVEIGEDEVASVVVFGEVVSFHVDEELINERHHVDPLKLEAVGRLGGPNYTNVLDVYQMMRPD